MKYLLFVLLIALCITSCRKEFNGLSISDDYMNAVRMQLKDRMKAEDYHRANWKNATLVEIEDEPYDLIKIGLSKRKVVRNFWS